MKTLMLILTCLILGLGMMSLTGASVLAGVSGRQSTSPTAYQPSDGPVAYWNFEEGAGTSLNDSSGNGHTGAINGATWVAGKTGQALRFDGHDDYVEVPNAPDLNGWDKFTFEAWVYRPGLGETWQFVLEKPGNNGCQEGESYNFLWRQHPSLVSSDGDWINSTFSNNQDQGFTLTLAKEPSSLDYAWHHFALTYDGSTLRHYVDGLQDGNSIAASGSVRSTTSPLYIGAGLGWCYMASFFKGDLDELKIYSRARTAAEIANDAGFVTVEEQDAATQYNGWHGKANSAARGGTYRESNTRNDSVSFKFAGKSISWITHKGPTMGKAQVLIDGVNKGTFDLYNPTDKWQFTQTFMQLSNTEHTFVVKVLGSKNAIASDANVGVDGFKVGTVNTDDTALGVTYNRWSGREKAAASGGSFRSSKDKNAVIRFTFRGTQVEWLTAKGPKYGKAQVVIDGAPKGVFDLYAGTQQWQTAIPFTGLSRGQHTIEIHVLGTRNAASKADTVIVDAFRGPFQ